MDTYLPTSDTPSLPDDHRRIREAAFDRSRYLLWLAEKLMVTTDLLIRKEAAKQLRQLAEGK